MIYLKLTYFLFAKHGSLGQLREVFGAEFSCGLPVSHCDWDLWDPPRTETFADVAGGASQYEEIPVVGVTLLGSNTYV